ncbi:MAG: hypothetical protein QOG91_389 [Candidatus Parcubacteria bacterium]|nr:hypothetical protein [Candidatus Parcubacteria bacterium]
MKIGILLRILGICLILGLSVKSAIAAHQQGDNYTVAVGLLVLAVVFGLFPTPKVRL